MALAPCRAFKLVANLPYNVATPLIMNLLIHPVLCPALMVVTIQRELAERMMAPPSTPAYGSLAVVVQALADVAIVRVLPPSVFWPRPKVESTVVAIRPDAMRRAALDVLWFHDIVRKLFLHRRKNLRHVLSDLWHDRWTKTEAGGCWSRWASMARPAPRRCGWTNFNRLPMPSRSVGGRRWTSPLPLPLPLLLDRPRRQDRGPDVRLAPSGRSFLEDELGTVGHGSPDAAQFGTSRFRDEPAPFDGLPQLLSK